MIYHKSPDIYAFLFKIKSINWQQQKNHENVASSIHSLPQVQFVCSEINEYTLCPSFKLTYV